MKPEDQVCAREYGEKLQSLGVKMESLFCYRDNPHSPSLFTVGLVESGSSIPPPNWPTSKIVAPAYTVAELGEMLQRFMSRMQFRYSGVCSEYTVAFNCKNEVVFCDRADTEADARALMLIWLIENGHVKAEDLG